MLPAKRRGRATGTVTRVPRTAAGEPGHALLGSVRDIEPLAVELVREPAQRLLFRELVGRHHYLGHTVPFGAHLRYLVFASRPRRAVAGCLQFSSPAWRMAARDRWVGWDDLTRARNLQHVVNNSRFLLLPWVAVRNLASAVLARQPGRHSTGDVVGRADEESVRPTGVSRPPGVPALGRQHNSTSTLRRAAGPPEPAPSRRSGANGCSSGESRAGRRASRQGHGRLPVEAFEDLRPLLALRPSPLALGRRGVFSFAAGFSRASMAVESRENNRELERLVKEVSHVSSRVLALITGRKAS